VRFHFTGTEFLYDYNANLSKAVAAKRLPLTILCGSSSKTSWVNPANLLWSGQAGSSGKPCGLRGLRGACYPASVDSLRVLPGMTGDLGGPLGPFSKDSAV